MKTMVVLYTFVGVSSALNGNILAPLLVICLLLSFLLEETKNKTIEMQKEIISLQEKEIKRLRVK